MYKILNKVKDIYILNFLCSVGVGVLDLSCASSTCD